MQVRITTQYFDKDYNLREISTEGSMPIEEVGAAIEMVVQWCGLYGFEYSQSIIMPEK